MSRHLNRVILCYNESGGFSLLRYLVFVLACLENPDSNEYVAVNGTVFLLLVWIYLDVRRNIGHKIGHNIGHKISSPTVCLKALREICSVIEYQK